MTTYHRAVVRRAPVAAGAVLLALTGCFAADKSAGKGAPAPPAVEQAKPAAAEDGRVAAPGGEGGGAESAVAAAKGAPVFGKKIVRNARASILVDDYQASAREAAMIVEEAGGYVASHAQSRGEEGRFREELVVKVPVERYGETLARIKKLGKVYSVDESSEDVTEEYYDLQTRLENTRATHARLLEILAKKAEAVKDVLEVERELSRVRGEMEFLEGKLKLLDNRTQYSTITLSMGEKGTGLEDEHGALGPLREMTGKLAQVFFGSIGVLLVVVVGALPWAVVLGFFVLVLVLVVRRSARKKTARRGAPGA